MFLFALRAQNPPNRHFYEQVPFSPPRTCEAIESTPPLKMYSVCINRAAQALCSKANTNSQGPLLRNANGIQMTRLNLLLAVLTKVCKLKLYTQDVYVNITAGVQVKGALAPPDGLTPFVACLRSCTNVNRPGWLAERCYAICAVGGDSQNPVRT